MVRFTRKKIDSMTLGEKMRKMRSERRLSLNEISKETRIQVKHLEYLENGEYSKLPADVYVRGFLRNYALFMRVNPSSLVKKYERERRIDRNMSQEKEEDPTNNPIKFSSFVITPKILITSGITLFLFIGVFLLYSQVNNFIANPRLVILNPSDGTEVEGRSTRISGVAEKDSKVFINDQAVLVNEEGEFSEDVGLQEGLNTITVKAVNKFEKESSYSLTVNAIYENAQSEDFFNRDNPEELQENILSLEVYVDPNPTWLSVEADGDLVYSGVLLPNSNQKFEAENDIKITSGNGKETFVKLNGEEEVLSNESGVVRDIIFTPDGRAQ